ncbi:MFS transporter [Nesterenkonia halophila]
MWAVAFACVIAFMGIGLVDPILPAISAELDATPAQSMLLFTSYLLITGAMMFFTSAISSRIGAKPTLLIGLALVVAFAALAGGSATVWQIIDFRAGWGLGNALFISTALATIVGATSGGSEKAIILYEAALGLGIASGPLLGGLLGEISWRGPFFGTAALMAVGLIAVAVLLPRQDRPTPDQHVRLTATFRALARPGLLTLAASALLYNFGFFTLLAYSPFPLEEDAAAAGMSNFGAMGLGLVFFGWGICLAITSVFVAPPLTRRFGRRPVLITALAGLAVILLGMALLVDSLAGLAAGVIVAGLFLGVLNTVLTESVMEVSDLPRPVASSTYSGVRFMGGAVAPLVAGQVSDALGAGSPYLFGAAAVVLSIVALLVGARSLRVLDRAHGEPVEEEAWAITGGDG